MFTEDREESAASMDALGSTVATTTGTGTLGARSCYHPFGATTAIGPANGNRSDPRKPAPQSAYISGDRWSERQK